MGDVVSITGAPYRAEQKARHQRGRLTLSTAAVAPEQTPDDVYIAPPVYADHMLQQDPEPHVIRVQLPPPSGHMLAAAILQFVAWLILCAAAGFLLTDAILP